MDKEFPAAPESIGGVSGDSANPNVGKYLQAGVSRIHGLNPENAIRIC